jgi:hypothetical protein
VAADVKEAIGWFSLFPSLLPGPRTKGKGKCGVECDEPEQSICAGVYLSRRSLPPPIPIHSTLSQSVGPSPHFRQNPPSHSVICPGPALPNQHTKPLQFCSPNIFCPCPVCAFALPNSSIHSHCHFTSGRILCEGPSGSVGRCRRPHRR